MSDLNRKSKPLNVRDAEEQLQHKLLNTVPALITIYNIQNGEYVYLNDAVEKFLGYKKQDLLDGGMDFVTALIHPEDLPRVLRENKKAAEQANTKDPMDSSEPVIVTEYRVLHKNKTWRWLQTQGTVFDRDEKGNVHLVMNISVDISERKLSEEWTRHALNDEINHRRINEDRLAKAKAVAEKAQQISESNEEKYLAFIQNSSEGIWRFELEVPIPTTWPVNKQIDHMFKYGYLAEANHAMAKMYGVDSPDDLVGTRLDQLLIPSDPQNIQYLESFIGSDYRLAGIESHEKDLQGNDKYFRNSLIGYVQDRHLMRAWGTQQDITHEYQVSANLRKSEERLALTIEASQMGMWEWNIETNSLIWSNELRKIYGIPKNMELDFDEVQKYNHPDDSNMVQETLKRARENGRAFTMTYRIIRPNREIHWLTAYGKAFAENGKFVRMFGTVIDINESKRREEILTKAREKVTLSEQQLNLALMASRVGIWEWNMVTNELLWSAQLKKIYGLKTFATITYESYTQQIHPDDRNYVEKIMSSSMATGRRYRIEHRIIWPDGSVHWVLGQGRAILKNGRPIQMIGTGMSIDKRKEHERTLRTQLQLHRSVAELGQMALTNIPLEALMKESVRHVTERMGVEYGKVFELLPDGKSMILRAAEGWNKDIIVGRTIIPVDRSSQSGYTMKNKRPVIVKDFSTEKRVTRPLLFMNNKVMSGITVIIQGADGPYGVLGAHSTEKRDFTRDDLSYLQSVANIIGLAIRQQALSLRSQELEAINSAKDEFISVASHHLRTPASAVKMYLGLLQEGYAGDLAPDQKDYINQAYESNEQQLQVIEDLLNVAEVDTNQVTIKPRREDIAKIVEEVLMSLSSKFLNRKQQVHFSPPRKPYIVDVDVMKMHLVLENIIGNASKYSPEGKSIYIKLRKSAGNVVIDVTDEGKGIDKADLQRIFDKFARIKNEAYISESGTGLGLYWAKKIVELHKGTITVRSKKGQGSTFCIHLPLAQ